ncbi:MAG: response regulator [Rhodothalassiaceae bacterium]
MNEQKQAHILIIDDDIRIRRFLADYLIEEGYRVSQAGAAEEVWPVLHRSSIDLITLDLGLPEGDGLTLAQQIRKQHRTPIIMITGKGDPVDRIVGLEMGADDYIAKPFHLREVLARIRAVLRRADASRQSDRGEAKDEANGRYGFEGWCLDSVKRELQCPEGQAVNLTAREFDLMLAFVHHPQRVLSRDRLMDLTKGTDWTPYDRSIDTLVSRLRRRLAQHGGEELVKTVRGAGYLFTPAVGRVDAS